MSMRREYVSQIKKSLSCGALKLDNHIIGDNDLFFGVPRKIYRHQREAFSFSLSKHFNFHISSSHRLLTRSIF